MRSFGKRWWWALVFLLSAGLCVVLLDGSALGTKRPAEPSRPAQVPAAGSSTRAHVSENNEIGGVNGGGFDTAWPDPPARLLQQMETARAGLLVAQRSLTREPQGGRATGTSPWAAAAIAAGFGFASGGALIGLKLRRRGRPEVPRSAATDAATFAVTNTTDPVIDLAVGAVMDNPVEERRGAMSAESLESRLQTLEGTILQILQMMEEREESARSDGAASSAPLPEDRPTIPPPARAESSEAVAAASVPEPATVDGRSLSRVRRAVLRLSDEGWEGESIAQRLRLGSGDVTLILKSATATLKARPEGHKGPTGQHGSVRVADFHRLHR